MISPLQKRLTQFFHFLFDSSEFSAEDALDRHDHNPSIDSCDDRALDSQNRTGSSDHGDYQNSSQTTVELFAADVEEVIPSLAAQWLDAQPDEGSAELELTELAIAAGEPLQYNSIDLSVDQLDALVHLGNGSSIEDVTAQDAAGQGSMAATTAIAHLDWGDALYHQGLTEEAIGQYRRAIEIHPTFAEAYHHLAEALVQQGNLDEAAACYRQAIELALEAPGSGLAMGSGVEKSEPSIDLAVEQSYEQQMDVAEEEATDDEMPWFEQASFHVQQAVVHCNAGQWGDAITVCRQAIEQLSPETGMAYFVLGRALQGEGELAEAEQAYRTALSIQPRSAEVYARLGSLYAQQQSLEQAVDFYQQAIAIQPDFTGAYWKLAEVWWQLGDRQKAILCRYEAVQLEPNWATAKEHLLLGTMLLEQGQLEQAIDCYQWAIERDTAYGEAYYRLGEALSLQGQWQKALVYLQQAVDCSPHHAQFYAALGQALTVLEQWQEAATAYQQMTELEPESIQGYIHLRDLLVKLEQWEAVLPCYQKLAELQPENATAWHELGDRLNQLEHWIEAVAAYQRAIERNPDFSWSHNNLGDALMHLERWQEATSAYQRAIERNPDFHWSHYNLGEALAKLEDWDGAIRAFRGALEVEPKSPFVHQKLANVLRLRAKADQATALMLYEQAINRDPDNLQNYHQAIDIQKNNTKLYVRLADALSRQGQAHSAQIFYHMAMQAPEISQLGEQARIEATFPQIDNQPNSIISGDIPFSYHPFTCHILYIVGESSASTVYRVDHQIEFLHELGYQVARVNSNEIDSVDWVNYYAPVVVIFRAGLSSSLMLLIQKFKQKDSIIVFDVDDYVFDNKVANEHFVDGIRLLSSEQKELYPKWIQSLRETIELCDFCIGSTGYLAQRLKDLAKPSFVIENGFDQKMLNQAAQAQEIIRINRKKLVEEGSSQQVCIGYASGTFTHQLDFKEVSLALSQLLLLHKNIKLTIVGLFKIDEFPELIEFRNRIEIRELVPHDELLQEIARFDINLAPLELKNPYCDAKSELKYVHAALLAIPTVASTTATYIEAIKDGENGFLASNNSDWFRRINELINSVELRYSIGKQAEKHVYERYFLNKKNTIQFIFDQLLTESLKKASCKFDKVAGYTLKYRPVESEGYSANTSSSTLVLNWIVPAFKSGWGGISTMMRVVKYLVEKKHVCKLWIYDPDGQYPESYYKTLILNEYYDVNVAVGFIPDNLDVITGDAVIATDFASSIVARSIINVKRKFYFIQDHEVEFNPVSFRSYIAKESYSSDFIALSCGAWLHQLMTDVYGLKSVKWELGVDQNYYFPSADNVRKEKHIAFYCQQGKARRLAELGFLSFEVLARRKSTFHIDFFGESKFSHQLPYSYSHHGLLSHEQLAELYRSATVGLVFSGTNYSIIPREMMACGLPVIEISSPSSNLSLSEAAILSKADPFTVADKIELLLNNSSLRSSLSHKGIQYASQYSWVDSAEVIETALLKYCK